MPSGLDTTASAAQAAAMTPEPPVLPDLADAIAHHRLSFEAAEDPATAPALAELLDSERALAAIDLGERLLEGVQAWLATAGVLEEESQAPYLEALADAIALRDESAFDFRGVGDLTIESSPEDTDGLESIRDLSELSIWFISQHESLEPIH